MSDSASPTARIAIVTGAAQGLGLDIALRLADDGLDVAVNDIESKSQQLAKVASDVQAKGRRALAVPADVSREEQVVGMIATVVKTLGGVDVMVANAGIAIYKPFLETSLEDWQRITSINLQGVVLCYKYAALQMVKQGRGGRIIGACSSAGKKGSANLSAYSATKFAIRGVTQSAALELGPHKITVNAYAPGFILTDLAYHPDDKTNGLRPGTTMKKLLGYRPDAPEGEPEVVASVVSYLAKPEAHFVTGQSINIDGGIVFD
ncbi:NAD-binding protein [Sparassis latifolia]